jgi:hypothetical protein
VSLEISAHFQDLVAQFSGNFHDFRASLSSILHSNLNHASNPLAVEQLLPSRRYLRGTQQQASLGGGVVFLHNRFGLSRSAMEFIMSCRLAPLAAVAAVVLTCPLHAEPLAPIQAQTVDLGALAGVAYYTVERDGDRLVLTLQTRQSDTPFRVMATLAPGQIVTLSVPRKFGEPAVELHFARHNEQSRWRGSAA